MEVLLMAKPTREELQATEFYQKHFSAAAQYLADRMAERLDSTMYANLPLCESPLEAAFMAWWSALAESGETYCLTLRVQRNVTVGDQSYRLDMVIEPEADDIFASLIGHVAQPKMAIELDGHDFHERTKYQVAHRNKRDRALSAAGWLVWHYSGSEFHRDPLAVVEAVHMDAFKECCRVMHAVGLGPRRNTEVV